MVIGNVALCGSAANRHHGAGVLLAAGPMWTSRLGVVTIA